MTPKQKADLIDRLNQAFLEKSISNTERDYQKWFEKVINQMTKDNLNANDIDRIVQDTEINSKAFERQVLNSLILSGITNVIEKQRLDAKDKIKLQPMLNLIALYGITNVKRLADKTEVLTKAYITKSLRGLSAKDREALKIVSGYYKDNSDVIRQQLQVARQRTQIIHANIKSNVSRNIITNLNVEVRKRVEIDGIERPQTQTEVQKALRDKYGSQVQWRVNRILDTELKELEEGVKWGQHNDLGYTHKKWNTQLDRKVRTSHKAMQGVTIPINERFILPAVPEEKVRGGTAMYPGDPSLPPEQRINERCYLTYTRR